MSKFKILSYEFSLEYKGLHLICFSCGKYGHRSEQHSVDHHPVEPIPTTMQGGEGAAVEVPME